jgi:hypothetical protein
MGVRWSAGPIHQEANTVMRWWFSGFSREPGGVIVTAEPLSDLACVSASDSGSRQPGISEASFSGDPYKRYFVTVTAYTASSFDVFAID